ncbi:MAG: recombinase family protein [bacterium]
MQESRIKSTPCAIYTRVSTDMQAEKDFNSCEAQTEKIKCFIESQEGYKLYKVYNDPGYTGANLNRPALNQMIHDIEAGYIDVVLTYKIDRLTRSPKDFYHLIDVFDKHGTSFISVTERFDTSTPSGRLLRNIMLTFGQFERELTSERIKDKFHQRVLKGLPNGGYAPFGYKWEKGRYVIDKPNAEIVKSIYDTYIKTRSLKLTTKMLRDNNIYSKRGRIRGNSFTFHVLRNPIYIGKRKHRGELIPAVHDPILSEDIFNYAQTIHQAPKQRSHLHKSLPYAGLIECSECNSIMSPSHTNKHYKGKIQKYYYYRCTKSCHSGWDSCGIKEVNADRFQDTVYKNLKRIAVDSDYIKNLIFAAKHSQNVPQVVGNELEGNFPGLTAEKLQKSLTTFTKEYARRKGFDQSLAVRAFIKKITYSKKKISVEWFYNRFSDDGRLPEGVGSGAIAPAAKNFSTEAKTPSRSLCYIPPTPTFKFGTLGMERVMGIEPT